MSNPRAGSVNPMASPSDPTVSGGGSVPGERAREMNASGSPLVMMGVLPLWADRSDSIHLREVARALARQGYEPWVVCLSGPLPAPPDTSLREMRVPVIRRRFLLQATWNLFSTIAAILAVVRSRSRIIYTRLDPGMFSALVAAALTRSKLVVELNGLPTLDLSLYRPNNRLLIGISRWWETLHYRRASAVVGASGYVRYVAQHYGVPGGKLRVVPLGVNTNLFRPADRAAARSALGIPDRPTVAWTGNLAAWQGLETLLLAAVRLRESVPECRVLLVGAGLDLARLKARARELALDDVVRFVGAVSYETVPRYIAAADVCVATFPGNRGDRGTISALKTLTYLACGRPVVTTVMDEIAEPIVAAGAGLAAAADDPDDLARCLAAILGEPPERWAARSTSARSLIDASRSWEAVAGMVADTLRSLR